MATKTMSAHSDSPHRSPPSASVFKGRRTFVAQSARLESGLGPLLCHRSAFATCLARARPAFLHLGPAMPSVPRRNDSNMGPVGPTGDEMAASDATARRFVRILVTVGVSGLSLELALVAFVLRTGAWGTTTSDRLLSEIALDSVLYGSLFGLAIFARLAPAPLVPDIRRVDRECRRCSYSLPVEDGLWPRHVTRVRGAVEGLPNVVPIEPPEKPACRRYNRSIGCRAAWRESRTNQGPIRTPRLPRSLIE